MSAVFTVTSIVLVVDHEGGIYAEVVRERENTRFKMPAADFLTQVQRGAYHPLKLKRPIDIKATFAGLNTVDDFITACTYHIETVGDGQNNKYPVIEHGDSKKKCNVFIDLTELSNQGTSVLKANTVVSGIVDGFVTVRCLPKGTEASCLVAGTIHRTDAQPESSGGSDDEEDEEDA